MTGEKQATILPDGSREASSSQVLPSSFHNHSRVPSASTSGADGSSSPSSTPSLVPEQVASQNGAATELPSGNGDGDDDDDDNDISFDDLPELRSLSDSSHESSDEESEVSSQFDNADEFFSRSFVMGDIQGDRLTVLEEVPQFFRAASQKRLVMSAAGDVFTDDISQFSMSRFSHRSIFAEDQVSRRNVFASTKGTPENQFARRNIFEDNNASVNKFSRRNIYDNGMEKENSMDRRSRRDIYFSRENSRNQFSRRGLGANNGLASPSVHDNLDLARPQMDRFNSTRPQMDRFSSTRPQMGRMMSRPAMGDRMVSSNTLVQNFGPAGDIHVGCTVYFANGSEDDYDDEITLDPMLQDFDIDLRGRPALKASWRGKGKKKTSFGKRIRNSLKRFSWTKKSGRTKGEMEPMEQTSPKTLEKDLGSRRCLLFSEEDPYDRTHILSAGSKGRGMMIGM